MENELFETKEIAERTVMVHVALDDDNLTPEESLRELAELVKTSGGIAVGEIVQNREKIHPKHYLGKGKVQELKDLVSLVQATAVVCDHELSAVQLRNLEEILEVKVLDRTLVILDIFASRAMSAEGKVQVELAQLKYRRAHIIGIGKALSRQGGGIGTRGPGEKKLETDRRNIDDRIVELNRELKNIEAHRTLLRENNKNSVPVVSLVGYTNAGKSTILNLLSGSDILAEDKLFATLDTTTRKVTLPNGSNIRLVDTVGFIQKLPHTLINAFRATLEELKFADIILHVVDSSSEIREQQMQIVYDTLAKLKVENKVIITAFNKIDINKELPLPADKLSLQICEISATKDIGIENLRETIEVVLKSFRKQVKVLIPYEKGGLLGLIHENCEIISESFEENGVLLELFGKDEYLNRVNEYVVVE